MAKSVQEQLIDVAPIMQVLLALGSGLGLLAGSLPETEFDRALGPVPQLPGDPTIRYDTYGSLSRFVSTLLVAVLADEIRVFILFSLLLILGLAFFIARNKAEHAQKSSSGIDEGAFRTFAGMRSRRSQTPKIAAIGLAIGFLALGSYEIGSYPRFAAPRHLENMAVYVEENTDVELTCYLTGGPYYFRLYGALWKGLSRETRPRRADHRTQHCRGSQPLSPLRRTVDPASQRSRSLITTWCGFEKLKSAKGS